MNKLHPKKRLNIKWTAVKPLNKEKHFLISDVEFGEDGDVIHCEIEAVMSKRTIDIDWHSLKDQRLWRQGWK